MAVSPNNRLPRFFLNVAFGKGPKASAGLPRDIVVVGYQKTIGVGQGAALDGVVYGPVLSAEDAANLWGYGSEMAEMVESIIEFSADVTIRGVCYAQPSGGTNFAIDRITIATNASAGGVIRFFVQGDTNFLDVEIAAGDTPAAQATKIYNAFLKRKDLQASIVTVPTGATVDIRWNHAGLRGNLMAIRWTIYDITGTTYTMARFQSGTTDANPSTALDALAAVPAAIIVCPDNSTDTATGAPKFQSYVNARANELTGLRGILVCAHTGTLGEATTFATSLNTHRCAIAWCRKAEDTPARIAARYAAYIINKTNLDIAANLIGGELANFRGPVLDSDRLTKAEQTAALNVGLCPLETFPAQPTIARVVRPITARFQDLSGNPDYACYNLSCVLVPDSIADEIELDGPSAFEGYKLMDDEEDNDAPLPDVMTPRLFADWLFGILRRRAGAAQIVKVEKTIQQNLIQPKIHPLNPDRILVPNIPVQVIGWFAQAEITVSQTTQI